MAHLRVIRNIQELSSLEDVFKSKVKLHLMYNEARRFLEKSIFPILIHHNEDFSQASLVLVGDKEDDVYTQQEPTEVNEYYPHGWFLTDPTLPSADRFYTIPLPSRLDEYLSSLSRKNRSNFKAYLRKAQDLILIPLGSDSLTDELREKMLGLISVKSPSRGFDGTPYREVLSSIKPKDEVVFSAFYKGEHVGYNYGYIEDSVYNDFAFFHDGNHTNLSSMIIAKLITIMIEREDVDTYDLGFSCDYKGKFVPENLTLNAMSIRTAPKKYKGNHHIHLWPNGYYYSKDGVLDGVDLPPYAVAVDSKYNYLFETFHPNNFIIVDGYPFFTQYYNGFFESELRCRVPVSELPPIETYIKYLKYFGKWFVDGGMSLKRGSPEYYELQNGGLTWDDNIDAFISSFKPRNRSKVKTLISEMGYVEEVQLTLDYIHTLLNDNLMKFGDTHSIKNLEIDVRKQRQGYNVKTFKYVDPKGGESLITFEFIDGYWVYQTYWHLKGVNNGKCALLAAAKYFYDNKESLDSYVVDLTSRVHFVQEEYNNYKSMITNTSVPVYGFTVSDFCGSEYAIKEPFYDSLLGWVREETRVDKITLKDLLTSLDFSKLNAQEMIEMVGYNPNENLPVYALYYKNSLASFAICEETIKDEVHSYINYIATLNGFERKGYASKLLSVIPNPTLHVEVGNSKALPLYEKLFSGKVLVAGFYESCDGYFFYDYKGDLNGQSI